MAKITFFELEDWEIDYMKEHVKGHDLTFFEEKLDEKNIEKVKDVEVLVLFTFSKVTAKVLKQFPNLKFIATMSTGFDHIDLKACKKKNIIASNVPSYGSNTVAEHGMSLLLAITKNLIPSIERTRKGSFSREGLRGIDLDGKTMGIIGSGKIGQHMAHYAEAFGMRVIAFDKFPNQALAKECGFTYVSFDQLLAESDVISLHLPENSETHHIINKENINKIKKGCILINTARGGLVDTEAILLGLKEGIFSACGLDVLEDECAISEEKELLTKEFQKTCDVRTLLEQRMLAEQPNVLITPHNAFNTHEALSRILDTTIDNINAYLAGVPKNVIK